LTNEKIGIIFRAEVHQAYINISKQQFIIAYRRGRFPVFTGKIKL